MSFRRSFLAACVAAFILSIASTGDAAAKYVFLFIGDGMGPTQVNTAEAFLAGERIANGDSSPRDSQLNMTSMRCTGIVATASLSGTTDSAAAATALATGHKTTNGSIGMDPKSGTKWESITNIAHKRGMKTAVISTAFLQDATPAAFSGSHAESRKQHYEIGLDICRSSLDFIGGAGFISPTGKKKDKKSLVDIARENGFVTSDTAAGMESLTSGQRAFVMHPKLRAGSMPFAIDASDRVQGMTLADITRKAISMLDSPRGFFMMIEGGRIDIACHANDAAAAVREVIDLDSAVAVALDFARAHPDETLVVVTADHETGGMTYSGGYSTVETSAIYKTLSAQKGSYLRFEGSVAPSAKTKIDDLVARAESYFGVASGAISKTDALRSAFKMSMTPKKDRPTKDKSYKKSYATYDPFTTAALHQANASLGITWTTYYHTGADVPIFAEGVGAEKFAGKLDNTDVHRILREAME